MLTIVQKKVIPAYIIHRIWFVLVYPAGSFEDLIEIFRSQILYVRDSGSNLVFNIAFFLAQPISSNTYKRIDGYN